MFLLGKLKKPAAKPRPRRYLIAEIIKFDRYVTQAKFLMEQRIDNQPQLTMLAEAVQCEIDTLTSQRKLLYRARNRKKDIFPSQNPSIESINQRLHVLRQDLKMCARIEADIPIIEKTLRDPYPKQKVQERPKTRPRTQQRQR